MSDDEEDLWGDLDEGEGLDGVMMSANLCAVVGAEERKVHEGDGTQAPKMLRQHPRCITPPTDLPPSAAQLTRARLRGYHRPTQG